MAIRRRTHGPVRTWLCLYATRNDYLTRYEEALEAGLRDGFILQAAAERLRARAAASYSDRP